MNDSYEISNRNARVVGALWLAVIVTGAFATLSARMPSDPASAAAELLASERGFRLAFVVNIISYACYVALTGILYVLLKPVSRSIAATAAFFGLMGCAIAMATAVADLYPLVLLKSSHLGSFTPDQIKSLAFSSFSVSRQGVMMAWVFFGAQILMIGYLLFRSRFVPRILGMLLALGGSTYVLGCSLILVYPHLSAQAFPILAGTAFLGEGSLAVWLLLKGLNRARWEEYSIREKAPLAAR